MVNEQLTRFLGAAMKRLMVAILASGLSATAVTAADMDDASDLPLKPTISTALGYHSNPEDIADPEGSFFHEEKAEVSFETEADGIKFESSANAEMRRFEENKDLNSWNYGIEASANYQATDNISVGFSASHEQEDDQGDKSNAQELSVSLTHELDLVETKVAMAINRHDDADNQFDHQNFGIEQDLTFWPSNLYSPFLRTAFTNINHHDQAGATVDRNARDGRFIAGVRYKVENFMEASLGGSYAYRNFNAAGTKSHSGLGIEADLSWTPWDFVEVATGARRRFKPTDVDTSLVSDVREVEASVKIKATDYVSYKSSVTLEGTNEIGADEKSLKLEINNRATYNAFDHLAIFAEFNKEWEKTLDTAAGTSEKTSAIVALLGVEASF
jgi:opacity protein-like surface antigen